MYIVEFNHVDENTVLYRAMENAVEFVKSRVHDGYDIPRLVEATETEYNIKITFNRKSNASVTQYTVNFIDQDHYLMFVLKWA
jgi:hypothetical protein